MQHRREQRLETINTNQIVFSMKLDLGAMLILRTIFYHFFGGEGGGSEEDKKFKPRFMRNFL